MDELLRRTCGAAFVNRKFVDMQFKFQSICWCFEEERGQSTQFHSAKNFESAPSPSLASPFVRHVMFGSSEAGSRGSLIERPGIETSN